MISKGKPLFDPKIFLSKVNGGRAISDYRKDQIVYTQGEPSPTNHEAAHVVRHVGPLWVKGGPPDAPTARPLLM